MELQRDGHIKHQRLIQERWKREVRREASRTRPNQGRPPGGPLPPGQSQSTGSLHPQGGGGGAVAADRGGAKGEREYDTLLYQFQIRQSGGQLPAAAPCPGHKTTKDDKTRLEEQQTTIVDLRRLVDHLMDENQQLAADNERLKAENARLRSEATDFVERSELWVLPQAGGADGQGKKSAAKGKEIAIPQLPPLEMPAQEDLCLDDLPPLELPEDIQHELQELLDKDKH